ncbi:phytoene/squalene synthase family protein [Halovivax limisalsi]|uniref:phytoene/squalene synthase family protein n=1 Tax=Halovivax limisalsi TaxID=1453760 RepID=UPI001FFC554A|nr:phytoene/squalene synthase family protein [Halovivax limisalsi]
MDSQSGGPSTEQLSTSEAVHRRTGRTFYLATRLFPRRIREATHVCYAFFRLADEVVDDPDDAQCAGQYRELARIEAAALGRRSTDDPVLDAFAALRERYDVPAHEVRTFIDAMRMDLELDRYESHDELSRYLRGSSVAVGNIMLSVMAPHDPGTARPHAAALAEAFQLTNFLRDVREDVLQHDRVYLPQETLDRFGVTDEQVRSLTYSDAFADAIRSELRRTEALYRRGVEGIGYLPADCQFPVLLAAVLYAEHHRLIRARECDVLSARPTLSWPRRLAVLARTWWHWRRSGDPVSTFEAASAVPSPSDDDRHRVAHRSRSLVRRLFRA